MNLNKEFVQLHDVGVSPLIQSAARRREEDKLEKLQQNIADQENTIAALESRVLLLEAIVQDLKQEIANCCRSASDIPTIQNNCAIANQSQSSVVGESDSIILFVPRMRSYSLSLDLNVSDQRASN